MGATTRWDSIELIGEVSLVDPGGNQLTEVARAGHLSRGVEARTDQRIFDVEGTARQNTNVVAVVLWSKGRVGLFRRSRYVRHDAGRWQCVTGYLPAGVLPARQALKELEEEVGLGRDDLVHFVAGPTIQMPDKLGSIWNIFTFACGVASEALTLNWEHDAYAWIRPETLNAVDHVDWFPEVLASFSR